MRKLLPPFLFLTLLLQGLSAQDTVRIMSYNVLNFDNTGNYKEQYFRTLIDSLRPDILVTQEIIEYGGATRFRDSVMRFVDTLYAMGPFVPSFDTDNSLYFRSDKFACTGNTPIHTELRDINWYSMVHLESGVHFEIFTVHLKASSGDSNAAQRHRELDSLLAVTATFPDSVNYIVCGDFNMYGSNETGYLAITDTTLPGRFIDPLLDSLSGTWNNATYARFHTQSTRLDAFGGGSTGGMDDRFDIMMYGKALEQAGGMDVVPHSLVTIGNDGNHYNDSINTPPNLVVSDAIADALYRASDHIPIMMTYVFETNMPIDTTDTTNTNIIAAGLPEHIIHVFPTPASQSIRIETDVQAAHISLFDVAGRMVYQSAYVRNMEIDIHALAAGPYIVVLRDAAGRFIGSAQCLRSGDH
ncbi:MAG: T9SS type A sorting domain-containing protein [Chitinophagales bacterium]